MAFLYILLLSGLRFLVMFVLPYFVFWKWLPGKFVHLKIQNPERQKPIIKTEILYTVITLLIQTLTFTLIYFGVKKGTFNIFPGFASRGMHVEIFAFLGYTLFYDAYFYWTHRLLHMGWLYKKVHVVHHRSLNPTPFTSFSFHPIETVINLLYFFPVVYFFPMSLETALFLVILTDFSNVMGHLGYELIPLVTRRHWWGNWLTTPTHHNLHHQLSKYNFGLFWNGWDKFFKTLHARTEDEFYRIKNQAVSTKDPT